MQGEVKERGVGDGSFKLKSKRKSEIDGALTMMIALSYVQVQGKLQKRHTRNSVPRPEEERRVN